MDKTLKDLKFDEHNFNTHTPEGMELLKKSIQENGYGRSVLVDKNNNLIAGNGVVETAMKLGGAKTRFVEVQGDELVVVKRKDLDINTPEGRKMACADNAVAAANLNWNEEELERAKEEWGIVPEEWGYVKYEEAQKEHKRKETERLSELKYEDIYFQPKIKPTLKLEDCIDTTKFEAKLKALDEYKLTEKQKETLKMFAYRFIRIDFESVANYYAFNATEEEKKAIERLRLVLTDNSIGGFINDNLLKIANEITEMAYEE